MFCLFLADIVCSMPLSIGTLKIYVTDICRMDLNILSSQMLRLKLLLLIFNRKNHTNFSCSWQPREMQASTPDCFCELAFMTVVNIAAM